MRIVVLEEIPEGQELRRAWNELALGMERPEVFYTHEWAVAVQRAYGDCREPLLFLGYDGDSLVGLVALAREGRGNADAGFLVGSTGDYCDFLGHPSKRQEFVEAVFCEMQTRKMDRIVLTNLPADSCSVAAISATAPRCRYRLHTRSAYLCARVVLGSDEQRSALKQATAGKKRLRRNLRELEKKGHVCVRHDTQWDQIEPILQSFNRAHVARFLSTGRMSTLLQDQRQKFLYELARELSSSNWITVSRLLVGDVPVAWNYGFQFAGSWFWYQPTVESSHEYSEFSPGNCLLAKIVELACDRREVDVVDLGLGDEGYKERFATASRETLYCVLNRSLSGHLQTVARDRTASVTKAISPLDTSVRMMISSLVRFRARIRAAGWRGLFTSAARQLRSFLFSFDEVLFFEWTARDHERDGTTTKLLPLNSDLLGAAATQYVDEPATLAFLMRSAQRLRFEQNSGFALISADGMPIHFCWVKDFEGFVMTELDRALETPSKDAVMIFDCFTPVSARGRGFFAAAIEAVAKELRAQGKVPWIFGAQANQSSLRGVEKSGFTYRFSLRRRRILFFKIMNDSIPHTGAGNATTSATLP